MLCTKMYLCGTVYKNTVDIIVRQGLLARTCTYSKALTILNHDCVYRIQNTVISVCAQDLYGARYKNT